MRRAVHICRASLGPGHPQTRAMEANLAALLVRIASPDMETDLARARAETLTRAIRSVAFVTEEARQPAIVDLLAQDPALKSIPRAALEDMVGVMYERFKWSFLDRVSMACPDPKKSAEEQLTEAQVERYFEEALVETERETVRQFRAGRWRES